MLRLLILSTLCILGTYSNSTAPETDTTSISSHASESTTKVVPETTEPGTSSLKPLPTTEPTTTPAPEPTTTPAPEPTTTPAPEPTTTPAPKPTTTKPASTTAMPPPHLPNITYKVEGVNNSVCILFKAGIQLDIKSKDVKYNFNPNTTEVSSKSTCNDSNDDQIMILEDGEYVLTLTFEKSASSVFVKNVSASIPEAPEVIFHNSAPYFYASIDSSYLCKVESEVKLNDNATVVFYDLQFQAFVKNETEFSHAEECSADNPDDKMSNVVPIAVAVALLSLVVLILIGYLITRRRSQQRQYQSM